LRPAWSLQIVLAACVSCGPAGSGPFVSAPTLAVAPAHSAIGGAARRPSSSAPGACSQTWTLDGVAGGPGRVVVVCGSDVRREGLDGSGAMAGAIVPGLEPARERVCACAARMAAPDFVDLVLTSVPDDGRVTAEAGKPEDDLDPEQDPAFAACVGTVVARFAPSHGEVCAGSAKTTLVYPLRIDLTP